MQQVNFFQNEFKIIEPPFSAAILLIVLGYSFIISLIICMILFFVGQAQIEHIEKNKTKLEDLNGRLEQTRKKYPAPNIDAKLLSQIDILKLRSDKNKKVLDYLENREMDISQQSFSTMLDGLSKIQQKNLWLTQIEILKGGEQIRLTGNTLSAESLPEYLNKLSEISSFVDLEFEVFDIKRTGNSLNFVVSSKRDSDDSKEKLEDI
ncbi:MAG: MSHA biogenesis protein MshI [Francisellaceae bacterium]|jgi:MSHA biogenesis protein MshI